MYFQVFVLFIVTFLFKIATTRSFRVFLKQRAPRKFRPILASTIVVCCHNFFQLRFWYLFFCKVTSIEFLTCRFPNEYSRVCRSTSSAAGLRFWDGNRGSRVSLSFFSFHNTPIWLKPEAWAIVLNTTLLQLLFTSCYRLLNWLHHSASCYHPLDKHVHERSEAWISSLLDI